MSHHLVRKHINVYLIKPLAACAPGNGPRDVPKGSEGGGRDESCVRGLNLSLSCMGMSELLYASLQLMVEELFTGSFIDPDKIVVAHEATGQVSNASFSASSPCLFHFHTCSEVLKRSCQTNELSCRQVLEELDKVLETKATHSV